VSEASERFLWLCLPRNTQSYFSQALSPSDLFRVGDDHEKRFIRGKKRRNAGRDSEVTCS
jgi:hypothetical protein